VAFWVRDIEKRCADLRPRGVELYSEPQLFDIEGYGKVNVVYYRDPDGTTLELMDSISGGF
jgi:catechol 2,3-dioxygenase-like lactoylglutathione lyase family enzyme